jgi:coenzyme Q-binding protein COQ10
MFDVVADVERYPEFLPLCEGLTVTERKTDARGTELMATMRVGYKSITEQFTTRVTLDPEAGLIKVRHLDGPFSHLENDWRFVAAGGGCDVHFSISYAFRSMMLSMIVGAAFDLVGAEHPVVVGGDRVGGIERADGCGDFASDI